MSRNSAVKIKKILYIFDAAIDENKFEFLKIILQQQILGEVKRVNIIVCLNYDIID